MKALTAYVEQQNSWNKIFGKPAMNIQGLTQKEVDEIARSIDGGLSPENLHCDGEISPAQARAKYNNYMKIIADLEKYCAKYGYNMPYMYEA